MKSAIAEIAQTYGIENWGAGYFSVNSKGHLVVHPSEITRRGVDVKALVDELLKRRVQLPVLLRFPQIFANQVRVMNRSFTSAMKEFDYKGESPGRKSGWGVANLIAEAYILEDNQTIRYSFPPELKRRLLDPTIFNLIDLRMQYHFTSYSALSLHELVSRYFGFSQKETFREHWTAWSVLLSGSATPHAEFRDFNKMLGRAVDQVNSIEGRFKIEVVVTKNNRKYDKLWFKLETLMQPELGLSPAPEIVGADVSKRLKALSLSSKDIEEMAMSHDEEYLLAQADYTESQMKKKDSVASPAAYFKAAVANNYAKAPSRREST